MWTIDCYHVMVEMWGNCRRFSFVDECWVNSFIWLQSVLICNHPSYSLERCFGVGAALSPDSNNNGPRIGPSIAPLSLSLSLAPLLRLVTGPFGILLFLWWQQGKGGARGAGATRVREVGAWSKAARVGKHQGLKQRDG